MRAWVQLEDATKSSVAEKSLVPFNLMVKVWWGQRLKDCGRCASSVIVTIGDYHDSWELIEKSPQIHIPLDPLRIESLFTCRFRSLICGARGSYAPLPKAVYFLQNPDQEHPSSDYQIQFEDATRADLKLLIDF